VKKVALIIFVNFALTSNVFSYTIITDPSVFYAFFENPAKVIDFTELKNGTSYITFQVDSNRTLLRYPNRIV